MREGVERFLDLSDASETVLFNAGVEDVREAVRVGELNMLAAAEGHFALAGREGKTVRLARTLHGSLRYLVLKNADGPFLAAADRMDTLAAWCRDHDMLEQFHPGYTRMIPAHYLVEIDQVGCPDPAPRYRRFFTPPQDKLPADYRTIGERYVGATLDGLRKWLDTLPAGQPLGLGFSGGADSCTVLALAVQALEEQGESTDRLRAYTLSVGEGGLDVAQARAAVRALGLEHLWEAVDVAPEAVDLEDAVAVTEDYKPLDVACAAMNLALLAEVRRRRPELVHWLDGDGGDENLKSYPLEDSELSMQSILRTGLLYQEGWGVDAIKHSPVYSGGLSRGLVRGLGPARRHGFTAFSPFTLRPVVAVAESIPFRELTAERAEALYALKGRVLAEGLRAVTGRELPQAPKRRFQDGAYGQEGRLRPSEVECRRIYQRLFPPFEVPKTLEMPVGA